MENNLDIDAIFAFTLTWYCDNNDLALAWFGKELGAAN